MALDFSPPMNVLKRISKLPMKLPGGSGGGSVVLLVLVKEHGRRGTNGKLNKLQPNNSCQHRQHPAG